MDGPTAKKARTYFGKSHSVPIPVGKVDTEGEIKRMLSDLQSRVLFLETILEGVGKGEVEVIDDIDEEESRWTGGPMDESDCEED